MWLIGQPSQWGPETSHTLRSELAVRMNAPFVVPTSRCVVPDMMREDRSTLTLYARNRLVSWVVSVLAVFLATGALSLAANGLRASDYLTAFVMVGVALAVVWLTWYVGWRKRPFHIVFITDHLEVGGQSIAYSDIQSVGLSRDGGDAYDPASMPVPRNYTAGPYVYVQLGARRLPVTVGLGDAEARQALAAVEHCLQRFRAG
jgi:hypothetical protein